jgi:chaperonin GroEL (HSP60 family)
MMTMVRLDLHYFRMYTGALEMISYTLAENAGLKPIEIVTELRKRTPREMSWLVSM